MSENLLDLIALNGMPSARGRKSVPLSVGYSRDLNESDLLLLLNPSVKGIETKPLVKLRHQHHLLARLLAEGRKPQECHFITGYSGSRISILQNDPAFKELIEYYKTQVEEKYLDVHARLAALGLNSLEELQDRIEAEPDAFTKRELMDLVELCFDRSVAPLKGGPKGSQPVGGGGMNLQINFVAPSPDHIGQRLDLPSGTTTIDITPEENQ